MSETRMLKLQKRNQCGGCGGCLDCLRIERSMGEFQEPDYGLTAEDVMEQALWDLQQWVKDHKQPCECYTCGESIPDLQKYLQRHPVMPGVCC
jgi:broad specificity phosphatase PhoE